MSRIAKSEVNAAFEWAAAQIIEAGGRDKITSRAEIRRKIAELTGAERDLVDFFYRFIVRQDGNPSERVDRGDVEKALVTAREQLVAAFDTNDNGLSADEVAAMPPLGRLAVKVARHRQRSGEELSNHFEALAFNLVLDDFGTELTNEHFLSFHAPAQLESLTAQSFVATLGLDLDDPTQRIARIEPAVDFFRRLVEHHTPGQTAQAVALAQAMQSSLADLQVYIVGADPEGGPIHPVYIVGVAPDGSLAGLRARVRWS
ncbi:nuclease A inhibitor family protein [Nannocystis punicea]|uniref:Nuclease n=1 Tax=Nannocystis punicea TaxID=2995304 RepID=A0ABY7GXQ5_9BACT|nr:nuclease A inhibitor family protein [Nannocystis poenicansa]WAS91697.1 nuclease [Nannocystis poenicansa]